MKKGENKKRPPYIFVVLVCYADEDKDVGMGLWLKLGLFLFALFFMRWRPYIILHCTEMILALVPLIFASGPYKIFTGEFLYLVEYEHA